LDGFSRILFYLGQIFIQFERKCKPSLKSYTIRKKSVKIHPIRVIRVRVLWPIWPNPATFTTFFIAVDKYSRHGKLAARAVTEWGFELSNTFYIFGRGHHRLF